MQRIVFPTVMVAMLSFVLCLPSLRAGEMEWNDLIGKKFMLTGVDGEKFRVARTPFIEFREAGAMGGLMCNTFRGRAELRDGLLVLSRPAATLMLCPDEKLNRLESAFFRAAEKGLRISLDGDTLSLTGDELSLDFKAEGSAALHSAAADELRGGVFELMEIDGETFTGDSRPRVEFNEMLAMHGKICNGFRGQGTYEDGILRVGQVLSTRMLCVRDDLSRIETRFLRALDDGLRVSCDKDRLIMRSDEGEFVFRRMGADDELADKLVGRRFILREVDGEAFSLDNPQMQPHIEFAPGLRVTGSACNNFIGPGRLEEGILFIDNAAATMKLCVDPNLSQFERDFHRVLREGAALTLEGDTLTLRGGDSVFVYRAE